jgi:hypothetical protein
MLGNKKDYWQYGNHDNLKRPICTGRNIKVYTEIWKTPIREESMEI